MPKYLVDLLVTWRPDEKEIEADSLEEAFRYFKEELPSEVQMEAEFEDMGSWEVGPDGMGIVADA